MRPKINYILIALICLFSFCYTAKAEDTSKWNGKCDYDRIDNHDGVDFTIYFNDKDYNIEFTSDYINENKTSTEFDIVDILSINDGFCPIYIYGEMFSDTPYPTMTTSWKFHLSEVGSGRSIYVFTRINEEYYNGYGKTEKPPAPNPEPIEGCKDLFGEDFLKKLNKYLNIVKIAVPIILIGYGVLDFSKAMFSGEDDMKKAQKNFLLRILAAILFFLLPIFVNLVLTLGNKVWSNINPDICIK